MSGPSVVVDWAPDGWTHIGGPGMHLLIGLEEDDEQTLVASDAADGGDLDDVIDVLTSGGMRSARHFVGVHWEPRTRLVAFGPVAATVTLSDGSEHEVRAASPRVWTDLELAEHPSHVRLRVLDETEAKQVAEQPVTLSLSSGDVPADVALTEASTPVPVAGQALLSTPRPEPAVAVLVDHAVAEPIPPAPAEQPVTGVPTFGGRAVAGAPTSSPWQRSWAQPSPAAPAAPAPAAPEVPAAPAASSTVACRPAPVVPVGPEPAAVAEQSMPGPTPPLLDVESTLSALSARSLVEPATHAATPDDVDDTADTAETAAGGAEGVPPSYDYLFGHTTTVDEHRRVLAELERPTEDDDDEGEPDVPAGGGQGAAEPPLVGLPGPPSGHLDTPSNPSPAVAQGLSVADLPRTPGAESALAEGGLISSVPWATPAAPVTTPAAGAAPVEQAQAEPEVVTFAGRHTPPPAPTLLPPAIVPPPGTRSPTAAPIITTGPPPPTSPEPASTSAPAPETAREPAPQSAPRSVTAPETTGVVAHADRPADVPSPDSTTIDDEAELTVDRSALIQAREAARRQFATGPSVLAVLCSSGHPTPPHSDHCRVCGSGIPPQEPFSMARPPLGVLRLSTGDVVTLDRSVLLGRAPRLAEGHSAADRPHVVKVPSPERDVSRNHVEVVLEGWHVLIRDLGTTNGTTVALPGEASVRLRANDQQVLEAGSLVSMADEVSFVFEAAP